MELQIQTHHSLLYACMSLTWVEAVGTYFDEDLEPSQFFHYAWSHDERNVIRLMMNWRPELWKRMTHPSTTFHTRRKVGQLLWSDSQGLGYTTPSVQSDLKSKKPLLSHSSYSSGWESDVSMGVAFKKLFISMISTSKVEVEEDIGPFNTDPWAQQLDLQWEKHFEQRDPPTEDKD